MDSELDFSANFNGTPKNELNVSQDKHEALIQENHELRKRIERVEEVNMDMENELTFLSSTKEKEIAKTLSLESQLVVAKSKIGQLEATLQEQSYLQKINENEGKKKIEDVITPSIAHDQEQISILTQQISELLESKEENEQTIKILLEEKGCFQGTIQDMECKFLHLQQENKELNEHLQQKKNDIQTLNETLESTREEKLLLNTELQLLKAADGNAERGNSLFAEVEENRQKVVGQKEVLKLKYLNLKKVLSQRQVENNKLKLEIVKIRREEKEDETTIHRDYSDLLGTYKERISELEQQVKSLEKISKSSLSISNHEDLKWVHTVVENAKKEAQALQAELERRGVNYVHQGHQLFDSQKANRKLKTVNLKLQSEVDELRLALDTMKAAKENVDGISPPATDAAVKYIKEKTVRFKEMLNKSKNDSINENKNGGKCKNESFIKEETSQDEPKIGTVKVEEGSNKENEVINLT